MKLPNETQEIPSTDHGEDLDAIRAAFEGVKARSRQLGAAALLRRMSRARKVVFQERKRGSASDAALAEWHGAYRTAVEFLGRTGGRHDV
jgi:hypothetical protein